MELYDDFYFIYTLVGPPYIKSFIHYFPNIPNGLNIVVITNTPELFDGIKPNFNLIVVDLESLREDWSKEYEKLIVDYDESSYFQKLIKDTEEGYLFPMAIMRYGIKWAYQNNITKFALTDVGCFITHIDLVKNALNIYHHYFTINNGTALIGAGQNPNDINWDMSKDITIEHPTIYNILKENNIDVEKMLNTESIYGYENIKLYGSVGFDGFFYGVYFNDVNLVKDLYKIYDELMKFSYENRIFFPGANTVYPFEWVSALLNNAFCRTHDTILVGHNGIIQHESMPEFMYYDTIKKFGTDWGFIDTNSRKEFLVLNRERLIRHYGNLEKTKKLVYDFE
jgi:hypothetical protein